MTSKKKRPSFEPPKVTVQACVTCGDPFHPTKDYYGRPCDECGECRYIYSNNTDIYLWVKKVVAYQLNRKT